MDTSPTKSDDGDNSTSAQKKKDVARAQLKSTLGSYWNVDTPPAVVNTPRPRRSNAGARMKEISEALHGHGHSSKSKAKNIVEDTIPSPEKSPPKPVPEAEGTPKKPSMRGKWKRKPKKMLKSIAKHKSIEVEDSLNSGEDGDNAFPDEIPAKTIGKKQKSMRGKWKRKQKTKVLTSIMKPKLKEPKPAKPLPELLVPNRAKRPNAGAKMKEMSAQLMSPKLSWEEINDEKAHKSRKSVPASSSPILSKQSRKSEPKQYAPSPKVLSVEKHKKSVPESTNDKTIPKSSESISPSGQRQKMALQEIPIPTKSFKVQNISSTKIKLSKLSWAKPAKGKPIRKRSDSISNEEPLELEEISHSKAVLSALRIPDYLAGENLGDAKTAHKIQPPNQIKKLPCIHEEDVELLYDPDVPEPEPDKPIDFVKEPIEWVVNEVCTKPHCKLGCVCESLRGAVTQDHCGKPKCFFECLCGVKPTLEIEDTGDIRSRLRPRARLLNWKRLAGFDKEEELNENSSQTRTRLEMKSSNNTKFSRKAAANRLKKKYAIVKTSRTPRRRGFKKNAIEDELDEDSTSGDGLINQVHLAKNIWENDSLNPSSPEYYSGFEDSEEHVSETHKFIIPKTYTSRPCLRSPELSMLVSPDDGNPHALFRWVESGLPSSITIFIENQRIPLINLPIPPMGMHWLFYKIPPATDLFSTMIIAQPRIQFVLRSLIGKISLSHYRNKTQAFLLVDEHRQPLLGNLPCFVYLLPNMPNLLLLGPFPKSSTQFNKNKHVEAKFWKVNTETSNKVGIPTKHFEELFAKDKLSETSKNSRIPENENDFMEEVEEIIPQDIMKMFMDSCIVEKDIRNC